jgi:hypothetical protein
MKKLCLLLVFLFIASVSFAAVPVDVLADFASSWLYEYNVDDYNLEIHPYTPNDTNDITLGVMDILWDLNSDGIVDDEDLVILNSLDITKMINDMEVLKKHPLTSEIIEPLVMGIYEEEKAKGVAHFKLFKILLWQSGFDVLVYDYQRSYFSFYVHGKLMWKKETQRGWIDIVWQDNGLFKYKYTYKYLIKAHINRSPSLF